MGRKYQNPPLIEALCEIQFSADTPWDLVSPGLIYEQVRDQFPQRRPGRSIAVNMSQAAQGFGQEVHITDRVQFVRADERAMIQVGPQLLVVNHLKPYSSWEGFRPLIDTALQAYTNGIQPTHIHRIGLRYINKMVFPGTRVVLEDYFEIYPKLGSGFPEDHGPFMVGLQFPCAEGRDALMLSLQTAIPEREEEVVMTLDLNYFLVTPDSVQIADVMGWVDNAHVQIEHMFEASITDTLRMRFDEVAG